ncbi:hypothetical protein [Providencia sp. JUb39]|uniref:hypothetical protein n=1 Tax=Providencia sp. JUb39 TaxID=2724165 RepID=UPI00164E69C0|nr:hypothetical protein [Providencia sp. JUb39]MBC5790619.1 hypothetical protein [Providencia sp. JUb39]
MEKFNKIDTVQLNSDDNSLVELKCLPDLEDMHVDLDVLNMGAVGIPNQFTRFEE